MPHDAQQRRKPPSLPNSYYLFFPYSFFFFLLRLRIRSTKSYPRWTLDRTSWKIDSVRSRRSWIYSKRHWKPCRKLFPAFCLLCNSRCSFNNSNSSNSLRQRLSYNGANNSFIRNRVTEVSAEAAVFPIRDPCLALGQPLLRRPVSRPLLLLLFLHLNSNHPSLN